MYRHLRVRRRLARILSTSLAIGFIAIVPSAFWLPAAPANATELNATYSNVTLPNSSGMVTPNSTTTIGATNWLNTTNLTGTVIVYVSLRNPVSSSEYLNFSSWTGATIVDDWFNGAAAGTSNSGTACSGCSTGYTTQGNFQNIIFTATSVANANTLLGNLQLTTPSTVGNPSIWVGASSQSSNYKYYWATRHFYYFNSSSQVYSDARKYAQTYPTISSSSAGLSTSTSNGYVGQSGYLATITDSGENSAIGSGTQLLTNNAWIGATDMYEEGVWEWDRNGGSPEAGSVFAYVTQGNSTACGTLNTHTAAPFSSGTPDYTFTSTCGGTNGMSSYTPTTSNIGPSSYAYTNGYANHAGNLYSATTTGSGYSNFNTGEPNNSSSSNAENAIEFYGSSNSNKWNDVTYVSQSFPYMVEFGSGLNDFTSNQPGPGMGTMAIASSGATITGGLTAEDFYMGEKNTTTVNTGTTNQSNEIVTQGSDSNGFFGGASPALTTNLLPCGSTPVFTETNFYWSSGGADPSSGATCTQATQWLQHDYGYFTVPGNYDGTTTTSVAFQTTSGADDGIALAIGGTESLLGSSSIGSSFSAWMDSPGTSTLSPLTLLTGKSYPVDLWYYNNTGLAAVQLQVTITNFNSGNAFNVNSTYGAQIFTTQPRFISITTPTGASLNATDGVAYSLTPTVIDAAGSITYTYSGSLPAGLSLNASTGVISGTPTSAGTYPITITATDSNKNSSTTSSFSIVAVAGSAASLVATQTASSTTPSGAVLATQPKVTVTDAYGNTTLTDTGTVTAALFSGAGGSLSGTTAVSAVSGVATFTNLVLNGLNGTAYVLQFTHTGTMTMYETVTATVGAATKLFVNIASNSPSASGSNLIPQPRIYVQDSGGNTVTTDNGTVTASVASGSLSGTVTVNAVSGVATYANLALNGTTGSAYAITFSRSGLTSAVETITAGVGVASKLTFGTTTSSATNGVAISPAPVIYVTDSGGNIITSDTSTISATFVGTVSGVFQVAAVNGQATFNNLILSYSTSFSQNLCFNRTGFATLCESVLMSVGPVATLSISQQAAGSTSGYAMTTQPQISAYDSYLTPIPNAVITATLTPASTNASAAPATFSAGATATTNNSGLATFSGLTIGTLGNTALAGGSYTITYSSGTASVAQAAFISKQSPINNGLLFDYEFDDPNSFSGSPSTNITNLGSICSAGAGLCNDGHIVKNGTYINTDLSFNTYYGYFSTPDYNAGGQSQTDATSLYNALKTTTTDPAVSYFMYVKFQGSVGGSLSTTSGNILSEIQGSSYTSYSTIELHNGYLYFTVAPVNSSTTNEMSYVIKGPAVVSGVWYYIGLVYTDKNTPIVAYVNGVTYNQTAAGSNVSAISRVLTPSTSAVGYQVANLANTYSIFSNSTVNMNVRSLQIYNQALSASQISYNYAALYSNTLRYLSGTGESGQVASQSTIPTVEVHDEYNNVIQGFPVYFISTASNGSNDNDSIVFSDSNGDAADSNFTYSTTAGIETTTVDTALTGNTAPWYVSPYRWSQQLLFYDTATVGPATKLLLSPGAGFPNGKAALTQPVLTLADQYNNPEYGMADTFSASISGGSVTGTSVSSSTGTGTFSNLAVTGTPGTPYTLTFSSASTGLTTTQSRVVPGSAVDTAMTFDGTTTYGATGSLSMSQLSDTSTTAEAWVKPVAGSCNSQQVVFTRNTVGGSNAVNYSWALVCASNYWDAFYYNTADSTWHSMQLGPVEFGQWQHLAYSFSSSNWLFVGYMNGIATIQQAIPNTTTFNTTASPLLVGDNANRVQMFNGQIDELKMWNVVRTTTQINADMNSWGPIAANNNLAIYYDFNDITGTTVYDKAWNSVSAEDLSITGTVATTDMKSSQTCTLASHTCIAFTRTYLNPFGGWQIPSTATNASVVVVAGGGGGTAQTDKTGYVGGGGGAGGYQKFNNATLTPNAYVPVIVGAGGYGGFTFTTGWGLGLNGTNSQFGSLAASIGGGAGGGMSTATTGTVNGASGGSGGGGGTHFSTGGGLGGGATSGQGNVGGYALDESLYSGYGSGGGGGAAGAGAYSTSSTSPALGSDGVINPFYGSVYLAGGGNGAGGSATTYYTTAGSAHGSTATGASASANTGSGGGGGGGGTTAINAGTGGTGVILFEYITALPIVSNPINESATAGTTTTFFDTNTVVSGVTRTYTWQYSSDSGSTWRTAPNGTATAGTPSGSAGSGQVLANGSYVTPTLTTVMNNYQYRVIVVDTDSFGVSDTTTATAALLTVNPPMRLSGAAGSATYGISNAGLGTAYVQVATGTGTAPYIFTLNTPSSTYYLDTSTASQGFVNLVITSAPAGNLVETVTVTDASGLTAQLPAATLISQAPTTTGFTANPAIYGQPDTLTATVSESTIFTTAGMVTFKDGSNNVLCTTSVFNVSDQASCAWTPGSTNTYYITAYFVDGAGNFASSQSSATPITPGKASVTESLTATSAVVAGATGVNALQLIATLNQTGSLAPTGTIAFTVNGATACGSAPVSTTNSLTTASCTYQAQGAGLQTVTATYLGDTSFNGANASTTTSISSCSQNVSTNNYLTGAPGSGYCAVEFTTGTSVWTVPTGVVNAQVLIVGGGGAGGERAGGGGGSGELLYTTIGTPLTLATTTDTITVGAGGQIETSGERGSVGGTSSLSLTTSTIYSAYGGGYGGGGGRTGVCGSTGGSSGGNDGGTGYCTTSPTATSHSSYSGFTSLVNNGGYGTDNNAGGDAERWSGGGGGGAGAAGGAGVTTDSYTGTGTNQKYTTAGSGGSGASVAIALNSATGCYAAGGGGGVDANSAKKDLGNVAGVGGGCGQTVIGGAGTAGGALANGTNYATAGTANTGSGGGGSGFNDSYTSPDYYDGRAGAGGSGVVIVKYLSPSIITTNWDASGDTMTVTSGTSITLTETATVFSFTRATQWQYSTNNGTSWALETATATAGVNSSSGNSNPTLSYTFAINCGLNTGLACAASSVKYLFRAVVTDTDTATNLVTASYSPTITVNVTAKQPTQPLTVSSTVFSYAANTPFTLITSGGAGTGAITYALTTGGTASGCSITGAALRVTSPGTCKVIATQAADLDYLTQISSATPVNFYVFISYVGQYVAPVGSHGIGGQINGGGINSNQNSSTAFSVTGITPTRGAAGISIVVSGTGFETGTASNIIAVSFNSGLDIVSFVINSPTQMTLTVPAGESGVVDQFAIQPTTGPIVYTPNFTGL